MPVNGWSRFLGAILQHYNLNGLAPQKKRRGVWALRASEHADVKDKKHGTGASAHTITQSLISD